MTGTNKLIGVLVGLFLVIAVIILMANREQEAAIADHSAPPPPNVPTPGKSGEGAEADTTNETLKTLSAQFRESQTQIDDLKARVANIQLQPLSDGSLDEIKQAFSAQIEDLRQSITQISPKGSENDPFSGQPDGDSDYPVSVDSTQFGFEPGTLGEQQIPKPNGYDTSPFAGHYRAQTLYTVTPSRLVATSPENGDTSRSSSQSASSGQTVQPHNPGLARSPLARDDLEVPSDPLITIPPNATLFEAVTMTALIGRVPVGGSVSDPMPVKIIIGNENLASNGYRISGLRGTVFSGTAVGDWALSCVRVDLLSATFVFDDGSFTTLNSERRQGQPGNLSDTSTTDGDPIGWISDPYGVPCIKGERISDTAQRVGALSLLGFAQGAAEGYGAAQQTSQVSGDTVTTSLTGSELKLLGASATAGLFDSAISEIQARSRDSFEAIYVAPATNVSVHIIRELSIDRHPNNRKINYTGSLLEQASFH